MITRLLLALSLLAAPAAMAAKRGKRDGAVKQAKEQPRVLVLDVDGEALTAEEAGLVRDALAREIARRTKAEVLSTADVRRVVDATAARQEADCETDTCLAELGAAMGASRVLHGSVARLGARYVLTLTLIDPEQAVALGRATAKADDVEQLYDAVPDAVADLVATAGSSSNDARNSGREHGRDDGFPVVTALGGTATAVGLLATVGTAGTFAFLFNATQQPEGDPALKQAWLDHNQTLGIASLVSAGVLVVGATVLVVGLVAE